MVTANWNHIFLALAPSLAGASKWQDDNIKFNKEIKNFADNS
jgi:hypothetical protein